MPDHIDKDEDIAAALLRLAGDDLAAARRELSRRCGATREAHPSRAPAPEAGAHAAARVRSRASASAPRDGAPVADGDRAAARRRPRRRRGRGQRPRARRDDTARRTNSASIASSRRSSSEAVRAHREKTPLGRGRPAAGRAGRRSGGARRTNLRRPRRCSTRALERAYRRGRTAGCAGRASSLATPELHSWRKNVKDLWHLVRLARKRISRKGQKLEPTLERLANLLGLDHDHAVLAEKLALSPTGDLALMAQLSLIADRRRELEAEAFELGARHLRRTAQGLRRARLRAPLSCGAADSVGCRARPRRRQRNAGGQRHAAGALGQHAACRPPADRRASSPAAAASASARMLRRRRRRPEPPGKVLAAAVAGRRRRLVDAAGDARAGRRGAHGCGRRGRTTGGSSSARRGRCRRSRRAAS